MADDTGLGPMLGDAGPGMLAGVRVIEIADERAEYTGLLLAGLGAEVIKIEPPEGNATRRIGPFLDDEPGPERSLFFWNYNRGKKSAVLDLREAPAQEHLLRLLGGADVLLDASCGALNIALELDRATLNARFPALVTARMTPFGDDGPWKDFHASDLIHLALGGIMMNCGYDPDPTLEYDTPPIAPQIWHAYHIAGEQLATGIIAALIHRHRTGQGQDVSTAVHEAVSKNPELDIMHWVMRRVPLWRLTNRHAGETPNHSPSISHTKDGRWFISHGMGARDLKNLVPLLSKYGMQADLQPPPPEADLKARNVPGSQAGDETRAHMLDVVQRFVRAWTYKDMPWREAQDAGLLWAPLRKPHENALDEHWLKRKSFAQVEHPELGRSFCYPTSKWLSTETSWQIGRRAPLLGEDTAAVLGAGARQPSVPAAPRGTRDAEIVGAARQAVSVAGGEDPGFCLVPGLGRRHAVPRRDGRRELQGGVEGQPRHATGGNGPGRRARCTRCRDGAAGWGERRRHGWPVQQQELRQARHVVEHPPSEGVADCQGPCAGLRYCRGGVLARCAATAWTWV